MNGHGLTPPPGKDAPEAREQWLLDAMFTTYSCVQKHCAACAVYRKRNNRDHRVFWSIIWGGTGVITLGGIILKIIGVL